MTIRDDLPDESRESRLLAVRSLTRKSRLPRPPRDSEFSSVHYALKILPCTLRPPPPPRRIRAFPDSLHADRIGHGRSIKFAPVNRPGAPSLLRSQSHFRIPAVVHFRSVRSSRQREHTRGRQRIASKYSSCA